MSGARPPAVSIVIPAYNSERYIGATLASVLAQSYRDYEVIVVDDGSTDGTRTAVSAAEGLIRYISQQNQGPAAARNAGISAAGGALICFLDADDVWTPNKLAEQVAFMERHPAIGLVFSDEEEFEDDRVHCPSLLAKSRFYPEIAQRSVIPAAFGKLLEENFIPTSTVMSRRECFDTCGLFDVSLRGPEDRDMWSRIAVQYSIAGLGVVHGRKRVVSTSVSRDVEMTLRSRVRLWTKARQLFPHLAPARTINALLSSTYLQLAFVLLQKGNTRESRYFALKTLGVSRKPSERLMAISTVVFSVTGNRVARAVFSLNRMLVAAARRPAGGMHRS